MGWQPFVQGDQILVGHLSRGINFMGIVCSGGQEMGQVWGSNGFGTKWKVSKVTDLKSSWGLNVLIYILCSLPCYRQDIRHRRLGKWTLHVGAPRGQGKVSVWSFEADICHHLQSPARSDSKSVKPKEITNSFHIYYIYFIYFNLLQSWRFDW